MRSDASEHAQDGFGDASADSIDDHGKNGSGIEDTGSSADGVREDALKRGDEWAGPAIDEAGELRGGVCPEQEQHDTDEQQQFDDTKHEGDDLGDPVQCAGSGVRCTHG